MRKRAKVVIEFIYDKENFEGIFEEEYSDEDFLELVEDRVYDDLIDLMRGQGLTSWADVTLEVTA